MRVLIDANVALDVILDRQPGLEDSKGVWDACHEMNIVGHLVATRLTNLFYCFAADHRDRQGPRRSAHVSGDVRDHPGGADGTGAS